MVAEIFQKKDSVNAFPIKAFFNIIECEEGQGPSRFGVSVPKKKFKKAVDRNHIKRLVKESIRLNKTFLDQSLYKQQKCLHIMIVCYFEDLPDYALVDEKIKKVLDRLAKRINSNE